MTVNCPKCRKALNVPEAWAGKTGKCPQCASKFPIPAPGAAAPKGPTVFNPTAAAAARGSRAKDTPKFTVSPGLVIGVLAAVIVVGGLILFKVGPLNAKAKWAERVEDAENDVLSVISHALQAHHSETGGYDPSKPHGMPQAREVMFYWQMFVMDLPEYVEFTGTSTDGEFKGKYYPHTGEVKADVDVGGMGLEGVGAVRRSGEQIAVAGKLVNGQAQATVNGREAKIVWPEKSDD